ncbi:MULTISPECIES: hypothetical protein [unclassified Paracoccus (in: a-proteobacteria)]|uniref:hypothetical protein n=1 Tax=unclassified Paracoccus (in: a-proteobacteria) TaxID=2688777 RepID=UPI0012B2D094|nr:MULTISPECIES: hypothetical protein [unclassified Paracoccus (in: a-proteobacteria)]UXU75332.1 hypothetical protein GB879_002170 [Paracoccus sp. SMMA_5]UXU81235.1 hypothetical protein GB880_002165 [Paracoccus sp. SMMA_5_TC]
MRLALAIALACLIPSPWARAQEPPVVMMCRIADESGTGWVPEFIMLTRQVGGPRDGRIEVFDPILKALVGRPIVAGVVRDDAASRSYGWALAGVRNRSGQRTERLDYRLTVQKGDGAALLQATALGYDNVMTGRGVCGRAPGDLPQEPPPSPRR